MRRGLRTRPASTRATLAADPLEQFGRWFADAAAAGLAEPNAMVLATVGADGTPAARTVLLKGYDGRGLRFFTNLGSAKAAELAANPRAALVFPWHPLERQVRVTGAVERLAGDAVDAYFATRPRGVAARRLGQPAVAGGRRRGPSSTRRWPAAEARFPGEVPPPPGWGGYRVVPRRLEFWAGRSGRLHDRLRYRRTGRTGWRARPRRLPGLTRAAWHPWKPGPGHAATRGPRVEGTCPPQARGSGDCLGFAGHGAGDPTASVLPWR